MPTDIEEKYLDRSDLFGLRYKQGVVFASVEDFEDTKSKPFSGLEDIESQTGLDGGFQQLQDADSNDFLHLNKTDDSNKVLHVGIGQQPWQVRRFTRYPEDSGKLRSIPNSGVPAVSDTEAYVDGRDSPYSKPTDAEELVIPPGIHVSFDFFNPDTVDHEPLLNIKMRKYKIELLDVDNRIDKSAIRKIVKPGSPVPVYSVGSLDNQATFNMTSQWDVEPVSMEMARKKVL